MTKTRKTLKRELAALALLLWMAITVRLFWYLAPDAIRALDAAYATLTMTVWLYAAAAFGMDSFAKQLKPPPPGGAGGLP